MLEILDEFFSKFCQQMFHFFGFLLKIISFDVILVALCNGHS